MSGLRASMISIRRGLGLTWMGLWVSSRSQLLMVLMIKGVFQATDLNLRLNGDHQAKLIIVNVVRLSR